MSSLLANVNTIQTTPIQNPIPKTNQTPVSVEKSVSGKDEGDVFVSENNNQQKASAKSKRMKIIAGIVGGAILLPIAIGVGALKYQSHYIKKAQKVFQNAFMRDDISVEETKQILERYRNINEIKETDKFIDALFLEAKKNFGLDNSNIKIEHTSMKKGIAGLADAYLGVIKINSDLTSRSKYINFIHHELRHFKQQYLAANLSFEDLIQSQIDGIAASNCEQAIKEYAQLSGTKRAMERDLLHTFNLSRFDISNVPERLRSFAKKVIDTNKDTVQLELNVKNNPSDKVSYKAYRKCFIEDDAFNVGESMKKLLGFIIPV